MPGTPVRRTGERGSALLETALTFPVLLLVALGLVQFALWAHAENVATDAAIYGARQAAEAGGSLSAAVATTRALVQSGLGGYASGFQVRGEDTGATVVMDVWGSVPLLLPGLPTSALPVQAEGRTPKEDRGGD